MSHVELKIRALLLEMDGYECKEPEPGKFTIAFGYGWQPTRDRPASEDTSVVVAGKNNWC